MENTFCVLVCKIEKTMISSHNTHLICFCPKAMSEISLSYYYIAAVVPLSYDASFRFDLCDQEKLPRHTNPLHIDMEAPQQRMRERARTPSLATPSASSVHRHNHLPPKPKVYPPKIQPSIRKVYPRVGGILCSTPL